MKLDTNIVNRLTADEQEFIGIIKDILGTKAPSSQVFIAGGWVRDKLLGVESDDIDLVVDNMTGENFANLIAERMNLNSANVIESNPEKSKHITTATLNVPLSSGTILSVDVAQTREETYGDGNSRRPTEVKPATPEEDAFRRDLTINSMFYSLNSDDVVDFTGKGLTDLEAGVIRTPLDPFKSFSDDPLRMLRVIRFAAKYNGQVDPETWEALSNPDLLSELAQKTDNDRIRKEFVKMLKGPHPQEALELMEESGLLTHIIGEAVKGSEYEGLLQPFKMDQNNSHHELTVWGHSMQALKNVLDMYPDTEDEKRVLVTLTAVMHDIGKLYPKIHADSASHPGSTSYHGHEKESAKLAEIILKYLKFENSLIKQVVGMARYHMQPHNLDRAKSGDRALRRFIGRMAEQSLNWIDVFNFSVADAYSKGVEIDPAVIENYKAMRDRLEMAAQSLTMTDSRKVVPILNGYEIMQTLNIEPGPWMSTITGFIKELTYQDPNMSKEEALNAVVAEFGDYTENPEDILKMASTTVDGQTRCSAHLLQYKVSQFSDLYKNQKYFELFSNLKKFQEEYGHDDKVARIVSAYTLSLVLKNKDYANYDLIDYIFKKAEDSFFDGGICCNALGILLLMKTGTDSGIIEEVGIRMSKMYPTLLKATLDRLPKEIHHPKIRDRLLSV